jgi:hypothetical protein
MASPNTYAVGHVRRAWQTAVLRAHGYKPAWIWTRKTGPNDKGSTRLSPESEAAYRTINLTSTTSDTRRARAG